MPALVGRRVKLARAGRNWTGCCPFHNEKTPSFHVYDDHFHCFGCGEHGDAIAFQMKTSGASFPEAVESLAAEAGLDVPRPSPAQARAEQQRLDLHGVLDRAQDSFRRRLRQKEGEAALSYLLGRGLADSTIETFGVGWSGDGRGALIAELRDAGIDPEQALEAGLLRETEDGARRELYWGRITFPIRDRRGRLISFGGRALGDAKPKYINGPESPVFSKRRTLYALDLARDAVRAKQPLIVAEGYMDVIALHQAGFTGAVAPLGTALTEEQLAELWRLDPVPVLCFDGDAAGARAAERSMALALPLLKPEQSLQIAMLPSGDDPDSLIRARGTAAFQSVLDTASPLVDALFAALARGAGAEPEQRAALRARLQAAAQSIGDRNLAYEFKSALLGKFFEQRRRDKPVPPRKLRTPVDAFDVAAERARLLTAIILRHPSILHDVEEAYAALELPADLLRLREHILHVDDDALLDSSTLLAHLTQSGTAEQAAAVLSTHHPSAASARSQAMPAEAEAEWWHFFGLMHRSRLQDELTAAESAFVATPDQASQRRLIALRTAQRALTDPDGDTD